MTRFKPRQRVWIINCTLGGRFLVEGRARVARHLGDNRYLVRFPDGELVERCVDPKAQADPYAYVREPQQQRGGLMPPRRRCAV
jgi:hypothetical protein